MLGDRDVVYRGRIQIPLFQAMDPDASKALAMTIGLTSMSWPLSKVWLEVCKDGV